MMKLFVCVLLSKSRRVSVLFVFFIRLIWQQLKSCDRLVCATQHLFRKVSCEVSIGFYFSYSLLGVTLCRFFKEVGPFYCA